MKSQNPLGTPLQALLINTGRMMQIDEHVLAGFIAGELTEEDRKTVTESLLQDRNLREWLHMASLALSAARGEQEEGPHMRILSTKDPVLPGVYNTDRAAVRSQRGIRRAV